MKKFLKISLCIMLCLALLTVGVYCSLRFGFGIDLLDQSGWERTDDGRTYYQDYFGRPLTDWQLIAGNWYYFDPANGGEMTTGWLEQGGHRYYLDPHGIRVTGWLELPEGSYYISPSNGAAVTGWFTLDGNRYYMEDPTGRMSTGWLDTADGRYYMGQDGVMVTGWAEVDGSRYYMEENGRMSTGWLRTEEGRCYLNETTGAAATGWTELETGRYYFGEDGYLCSGWTDTESGRYYLTDDGQPTTGWLDYEEDRYYLDETGLMTVGWYENEEGTRYYFREDGTMAVGQVTLEEVNHFFTSTGAYIVLVNKWNPLPEDYKPDLITYKGYEFDRSCYEALKAMFTDLRQVGYYEITSAYRSKAAQKIIWNNRLAKYRNQGYSASKAEEKVALEVAVPGTSEHHLGTAVDISAGEKVDNWLAENSWRYGFILRYPEGKTEVTGIIYEPWHFRYVGKELAKELYDLGLCLEEYMTMLTATQADVPVSEIPEETEATEPAAAA